VKVVWTDGARADLRELVAYIAEDNVSAARNMAARLRKQSGLLQEHPEMGRMVPEFGDAQIRERIVAPYRLVYRLGDDVVEVLAVVHSRRLMPEVE
jgi:toxin ParE1/3/4